MKIYNKQNVENRTNLSYKYSYLNDGLYTTHRLQEAVVFLLKSIEVEELEKFDKILDLGCGQGQWMNFFHQFFFGNIRPYGIDLSPYQIAKLKLKFPEYEVECTSMSQLPYPDNYFDLLSAFTSFMFIKTEKELREVFSEANRVLKDDGYLLIEDVFKRDGHFNGKQLLEKEMAGYNLKELDNYANEQGFKRVVEKSVFKRFFWSQRYRMNSVNLSSYIGYTMTYLFELILPGEMNNFVILYKKVK
jgi:ubiquinone/menaquinone biosynthesis C-methylase UbiE